MKSLTTERTQETQGAMDAAVAKKLKEIGYGG